MNRAHIIASCALVVVGSLGCIFGGQCPSDLVDELEWDVAHIQGTRQTYRSSSVRGELVVDIQFEPRQTNVAAVRPCAKSRQRSLYDLLVPDAHALDCGPPSTRIPLTFSVEWTPTDGEPVIVHDEVEYFGEYKYSSGTTRSFDVTSLDVEWRGLRFELVSDEADARTLELRYYSDDSAPDIITGEPG